MTSDAHVLKSFVIQLLGTRKRRFTFLYRWNTRQPFVAACLEDVIKQWFKLLLTTPIDLYMTHNEIRLWAHEPGLSIPFAWLLQHERDILKWMFDLVKLTNKTIEIGFYLLFFLVPLMMTPFNYELFEFNKMMLVYLLTAMIVAAWLAKMALQKRIIFQRSFWDIPLLIFLISQFLSFLFSLNRHTSLWGYYSRSHGG